MTTPINNGEEIPLVRDEANNKNAIPVADKIKTDKDSIADKHLRRVLEFFELKHARNILKMILFVLAVFFVIDFYGGDRSMSNQILEIFKTVVTAMLGYLFSNSKKDK